MRVVSGVAIPAAVVAVVAGAAAAQPPMEALPAILRLQLDQHPAWRAYKDALAQTRAEGAEGAAATARMNGLTTPERLDAMRDQMKAQTADFERQAAATEAFYAALSPEQKAIFDRVTRLPTPPAPLHPYPRRNATVSGNPQVLRTPPTGDGLPPPAE